MGFHFGTVFSPNRKLLTLCVDPIKHESYNSHDYFCDPFELALLKCRVFCNLVLHKYIFCRLLTVKVNIDINLEFSGRFQ